MTLLNHRSQKASAVLAFLCALLIVYLSISPRAAFEAPFSGFDKIGHAVFYAVLGLLCAFALSDRARGSKIGALGVVVLVTGFGGAIELYQAGLPDREAEGWDLLADGVGAVVAAVTASRLRVNRSNFKVTWV